MNYLLLCSSGRAYVIYTYESNKENAVKNENLECYASYVDQFFTVHLILKCSKSLFYPFAPKSSMKTSTIFMYIVMNKYVFVYFCLSSDLLKLCK